MDHRFEIWNQGSLIFGEEYISIIRKSENVQILINEIKKIKIYKGILGNIKIRINLNDKYYIVSILFRDLSIILEEIKTLNKQNETLIIEMFSEKNNFIIMGENNIKKSNKVKKGVFLSD